MKHRLHDPLAHLHDRLEALEARGLRRRAREPGAGVSFCSNDYLGLARRPAPPVASGAGASRLVAGEHGAHAELERALASWLGAEASLLFTSGYAANVGAIAALAEPGDLIVSDALNHASIIDGARLSRARVAVTPHNDLGEVERALATRGERRAWVVVESYYSMDADGPDLGRLRDLCDAHGAGLYVDEAHALGVLGPAGRGLAAAAGVAPDVVVGTLGKALGSQGAFVAGRAVLRDWLWNRARSFVFSTGLSPAAAAAASAALGEVLASARREKVATLAERLRAGLAGLPGLEVLGFGHVVPVVAGSSDRALRLAALVAEAGVDAPAIRPPTVPEGTARLRLTVTAAHTEDEVDQAAAAVRGASERLP